MIWKSEDASWGILPINDQLREWQNFKRSTQGKDAKAPAAVGIFYWLHHPEKE